MREGFGDCTGRVIGNAMGFRSLSFCCSFTHLRAPARLLLFGRLEEAAKADFWLPGVFERLLDLDVRLTVAGDGPDKPSCSAEM